METHTDATDDKPSAICADRLRTENRQAGAQERKSGTTWHAWHRIYSPPVLPNLLQVCYVAGSAAHLHSNLNRPVGCCCGLVSPLRTMRRSGRALDPGLMEMYRTMDTRNESCWYLLPRMVMPSR